jgi:DNA helicase II / ATP-dependent DNA helicase PcrA
MRHAMNGTVALTAEQKRAIVLMPDHNVQIIACAGSGKTEIVSRGISEIIRKGAKPSEIVAFTFTEKAAEELKARVRLILNADQPDRADLGDMYIGTIHSFCFEKLKEFWPEFKSFDVLDEASRVAYISKPGMYYNTLKLNHFESYGKSDKALKKYTIINRFIESLDIFLDESVNERKLKRSDKALCDSIKAHLDSLKRDRYLDFGTMISELVTRLDKDKVKRKKMHEKLRYLVVDEYQDINGLQERLIKALVGPGTRITVVGDDDQSIYGWRGSVVDYIRDFRKNFKHVKAVRLEKNFRSTSGIIRLANSYIARNKDRLPKRMLPANIPKAQYSAQDIQHCHFRTEDEQAHFIIKKMQELVGTDFLDRRSKPYSLNYADMAVLIRTNDDIRRFMPYLEKAGINFVVDSGETVFEADVVECARDLLDYVFGLHDGKLLDIVRKYREYLKKKKIRVISQRSIIEAIILIKGQLDELKESGKKDYLPDLGLQGVYYEILNSMGLDKIELSDIDHYYLAALSRAISDYEKVWQRLRHTEYKYFRGFIQAWGKRHYAVSYSSEIMSINAVKLMTIHKAKGLEFPVVFIPYLNQKAHRNSTSCFVDSSLYDYQRYAGTENDERHVYYVAMTRSEKYLFLSGMEEDDSVKNPRQPALVHELDKKLLSPPKKLIIKKSGYPARTIKAHEFATTFSDLSAYGRCGYDYKMRYVFGYNAGVPVAFGYGTQLHNILNIIHKEYKDGTLTPAQIDELLARHFYLRYAPGSITEPMRRAARRVILNYVSGNSGEFKNVLETEKRFEFMLDSTLITGQIDLIKKIDNSGNLREIEIVDFKSDTNLLYKKDYEHQLRLYALACIRGLKLAPQKACIHDLDGGQKKYVDIDSASLGETENEITARINGIKSEQFMPARNDTCIACDYTKICCHGCSKSR